MRLRMIGLLAATVLGLMISGCDQDATNYEPQVRALAAAEMHCEPDSVQITPIHDRHGTHTFVCDGCGCTATYICSYKDYDSCEREPALEPLNATCK